MDAGLTVYLEMHPHLVEDWITVIGTANVEINNDQILMAENESTYITLGSKHRLSNSGKMELVMIEVQGGAYLLENDTVGFDESLEENNNAS